MPYALNRLIKSKNTIFQPIILAYRQGQNRDAAIGVARKQTLANNF